MPVMNGLEAAKLLSKILPDACMILLTAFEFISHNGNPKYGSY
jgi:hypothetical protein